MEKVYTFTKSQLVKIITLAVSVLFVAIGIFSFLQGPVADALDLQVDNSYFFQSDITIGIILIFSGLLFGFVAFKMPKRVPLVLKVFGVLYVVFGILCVGHGYTHNTYDTLLGIFWADTVAGWLYIILGIIAGAIGFKAKGNATVTLDVKKEQPTQISQ